MLPRSGSTRLPDGPLPPEGTLVASGWNGGGTKMMGVQRVQFLRAAAGGATDVLDSSDALRQVVKVRIDTNGLQGVDANGDPGSVVTWSTP